MGNLPLRAVQEKQISKEFLKKNYAGSKQGSQPNGSHTEILFFYISRSYLQDYSKPEER